MDCVNVRLNGELIQFDCPNCGVDAEINEETLTQIRSNFDGSVTCPLPQGCNSVYNVPAEETVKDLKSKAGQTGVHGGGVNDTIGRMIDEDGETEPTEEDAIEEEKPKPTGPFRYESKSEEASAWTEEFENKKSEKSQKPITSPLAIRTFRNKECIVQGQNRFDDVVSSFLGEIGKDNVICVSPINYTDPQDKSPDYGVVVYYQNLAKQSKRSERPENESESESKPAPEPVVWRD